MTLAYVIDEVFESHRPPSIHPECPERLEAVRRTLKRLGLDQRGRRIPVRRATEEELGRVHTAGYLAELARIVPGKHGWLEEDTYFSPGTWESSLAAAAAAVDAADAVISGRARRALAAVRPPGHHAEADRPMGFCLFNNVAVGAAAARALGAQRVAIIDWDVHHGNGTQAMFYRDPNVLFLSIHQFPFYPGTGAADEIGDGAGLRTTVNVPLPAGCGDREYLAALDELMLPAMRSFDPDIILVSAGFDAHAADPLGAMELTTAGYGAIARRVCRLADEVCDGRLVAVLEGGYDLGGLAGGVGAMVEAMSSTVERAVAPAPAGDAEPVADAIAPGARLAIDQARRAREAA